MSAALQFPGGSLSLEGLPAESSRTTRVPADVAAALQLLEAVRHEICTLPVANALSPELENKLRAACSRVDWVVTQHCTEGRETR